MKAKLGHVVIAKNQKRHPAANKFYGVVWVVFNGKRLPLAGTEHQFRTMLIRADKNREDVPELV